MSEPTKTTEPEKETPELDALAQDQLDEVVGGCASGNHINEVGTQSSGAGEVSSIQWGS
jgi:hypothetical protein